MSEGPTKTSPEHARWSDEHVETLMGNLLRVGVLLAATVVVIGGVFYLTRHGHAEPEYVKFHGEPIDLRTLGGVLRSAFDVQGRGIIQLGLLLLIATPVARVAFAVLAFARTGDRLYVIVSLVVLTLLLASLIGAMGV